MKLPEPFAGFRWNEGWHSWQQVIHEAIHHDDVTRMFTETQLRAEIERRDAVLRMAREELENHMHGREPTFGTVAAIKAIQEVLR